MTVVITLSNFVRPTTGCLIIKNWEFAPQEKNLLWSRTGKWNQSSLIVLSEILKKSTLSITMIGVDLA